MLTIFQFWTGWLVAGGLFFLACLILIIVSPIRIDVHMIKAGNNEDIEVRLKGLYGLIRYHIKVPIIQFKGRSIQFKKEAAANKVGFASSQAGEDEIDAERVMRIIERIKEIVQLTYDLKGIVKESLSRVEVKSLSWTTTAGVNDAMWTAMATGLLWSAKTTITGILSHMVQLQNTPQLTVVPAYNRVCFSTELRSNAEIKAGYAMLAALQLLIRMKKNKHSLQLWRKVILKMELG